MNLKNILVAQSTHQNSLNGNKACSNNYFTGRPTTTTSTPLAKVALSCLDESTSSSNEWHLNPSFWITRKFIGRSFAGTDTVAGEPLVTWALKHFSGATSQQREEVVRFLISAHIAETTRKGGVTFARHSNNGTDHRLASLVIVREFDTKQEMSLWTKTSDALHDIIMAIRLVITDGTPALWTKKEFKQPGQIGSKMVKEMLNEYKASHVALMPYKHWYVAAVGTEPELQGTGQGSVMMNRIVQLADKANVDCYLEANGLNNKRFYEKFGFQVHGSYEHKNHWDCNGPTMTTYYMIRPHNNKV